MLLLKGMCSCFPQCLVNEDSLDSMFCVTWYREFYCHAILLASSFHFEHCKMTVTAGTKCLISPLPSHDLLQTS